jgi:hypothetical protein
VAIQLRYEKSSVALFNPGSGSHEALRIELMVGADQERTELSERHSVAGSGRPDDEAGHGTDTFSSAP